MRLASAPQDSKRMFGYQVLMNADLPLNQNKAYFQAFTTKYGQNWPETTKDYFNVSNSTLLNKDLTFI